PWTPRRCHRARSLVLEADRDAEVGAVLVGLQAGGPNAERGQLLVALLHVAGDADRPEELAVVVADQHAAALGKDLSVGGAQQIVHEERPLLGAKADQARGPTQR